MTSPTDKPWQNLAIVRERGYGITEDEAREQAREEHWEHVCPECGGDFQRGDYVPHAPGCAHKKRPWDNPDFRTQEREANALRHLGAPFPVPDERPLDPDAGDRDDAKGVIW